ncbi:tyrosine-protein kinase [Rhabdobacter roseus]|uniref:non-specific protein-tyrosine kinase n=1 Tax=Rhabdobacter roseus TaxID=1655419 RepID=A0A840TT11_9BACT|nr:polysaccharide biosynthesis tyrosine autokinase [Rhabdobacter roseus]MBB5284702.1 capsular exopolysaccharide synthesis family protein [Rhabdobacter roseus]
MADRNHPQPVEYVEVEEQEFDLQEYLRRYLRYWYLFPLFVVLTLVVAFFYLQITQPIYSSTATLLIKDQKKGLGGGQADILEELAQFSGNKLVENEVEILTSQTLMGQVVKDLGLEVAYQTRDGLRTVDLYRRSPVRVEPEIITELAYEEPLVIHLVDSTHFRVNDESEPRRFGQRLRNDWGAFTVKRGDAQDLAYTDVQVHFRDPKALTEGMLERLTVQQPNVKSTVLSLTFEDPSVQRGKDVLNKLLDVYVQSSLNDKNSEASNTLKFIEDRLGLITGELSDVERGVESYKREQGLTDISAESQLFLENIQQNDAKLNEVNTQIQVLESVDNYIKNAGDGAVAPATYMINDPVLVSLLTRFNELELQRERYARTTTANNPLLETVTTQLANTRQAIRENVQNLRRGLDVTRQNLQSINTRFSAGLRSIPQKEREYVGIKRQQTIKENLYLYLLQKREETALAYASTVTDSRLIDAPVSTVQPVKPKRALIWLGAGAAGIVIPLLLINALFLLNNTVQTRDDVESMAHVSVLGEIGLMKSAKEKGGEAVIKMTSRSAVAEQFRALRTNLQYLGDGRCRTLMFTSSIGGEGKSFVSINLAASLAYSDKRVVLVGMDLRKPTLHERLEVPNDRGVTNYLIGQSSLRDLIQTTPVHPKFDVITSGPIPPNPSELLSNGRLPQLLSDLRQHYDYILIDSPPYGLVTDAALISEHVDATLYLVRFNYTLRDHLKRIGELHRSRRFANLSVVFNGVNYGAGYGYGYGYGGYGYGYYADEKESKARTLGERMKRMVS